MEKICEKNLCTGCQACASVCPKNAIVIKPDNATGGGNFLYPFIDKNLCIDCGLCKKTCPVNNYNFKNNPTPDTYAVMANDEIRKVSSSGGAFTVLAEYVLNQNGVVAGASFDENMNAKHIIIDNKNDLNKLRGSKYVQSDINNCFKEIKKFLESDKKVLFTGCPCQVAGLQNYLNKDYDNLITVDLICHGVPSQKILTKYLEEEFPDQKVLNINFRDKINGWGVHYTTTITTTKGTFAQNSIEENTYMKLFVSGISLRESCYKCQYTKLPRTGDFTIADCWGASKKNINDGKGTSSIFLNNKKAESIFKEIRKNFILTKRKSYKFQLKSQPHLNYPTSKHPAVNDFLSDLDFMTLKQNLEKNICSDKNVALLNYHWENENFGALLTAFALNYHLNSAGFNAQNIDYIPHFPWIVNELPNKYFDDFRAKYLPMTKRYYRPELLTELNLYFKHFIVGSDQVWRYYFIKNDLNAFFFSFTNPDKNILSCAASFGTKNIDNNNEEIRCLYKNYLNSFDSISIREQSGIDYCKNNNINAAFCIDPVFFPDKKVWDELINADSDSKSINDIVYYTINDNLECEFLEFINQNKDKLQSSSVKNIKFNISVEEWLFQIKNCKFMITDSFHGVCFAIIFNKPFVCVNKNLEASIRMQDLFSLLEIENRLYESIENININQLIENRIDYSKINEKLSILTADSKKWLLNALSKNISVDDIKRKEQLKKECFKLEYKIAKKNILKNYLEYNKYKIRLYIFKDRQPRIKAKYGMYQQTYKNYKNIIKKYKKLNKGK